MMAEIPEKEPSLLTEPEHKRSFGKALLSTHVYPPPAKGGMDRCNKGNKMVLLLNGINLNKFCQDVV